MTIITASAPTSSAALLALMLFAVEFEPVPASTGTRPFATLTARAMISSCSSSDRVGASPVVPQGTSPLTPPAICSSHRRSKASKSTFSPPPAKGVTRAVHVPRKLTSAMTGSVYHVLLSPSRYGLLGVPQEHLDRGHHHPRRHGGDLL